MSIEPLFLVVALLAVFFGGLIQGLTGFGFALVAVPVLSLFISPKLVVPLVVIHGTLSTLMVFYHARKSVQVRHIWPLAVAGIVGIPVGAWVLAYLSPGALRLLIGVAVTTAAALMALGIRAQIKNERLAFAPVGFASGVLGGSIGLGGPPVILFFTNQRVPPGVFRANLAGYFLVLSLVANATFFASGLTTLDTVKFAALLLPGLVLGVAAGNHFSSRLPERLFRGIALTVVTSAGLLSIANGLGIL